LTLTLLLDLDDTLLSNQIDTFVPHYLQAFSQEVAGFINPELFLKALWAGTQAMADNRRPDRTLQATFEAAFFPLLGVERAAFQPLADRFYEQVFPTLRRLTQPKPGATDLVNAAFQRGYRIVIATNPLFPRTAIEQRLSWANLSVDQYAFDFIPSYETFHFAKPFPAYFYELLGHIGFPDGPMLMVGDDLQRDITAAALAGLPTFWVANPNLPRPFENPPPLASGSLVDVLPWLDQTPSESLMLHRAQPSALLAALRATPAVLDTLCLSLPEPIWTRQPQPGEWSLTEILCHLRDVDQEVNLGRIDQIVHSSNPFLAGVNTDPWASERKYIRQELRHALQQFTEARLRMLELLESLQPEDWQRPARHAILGPTNLTELVNIITAHDWLHIQQAQKVL
jgi:FMN phosphatase YigB (HAD superfamily)